MNNSLVFQNMNSTQLLILIGIGSGIAGSVILPASRLIEQAWSRRLVQIRKKRYNITTIVNCDFEIDKILWNILQREQADRVFIWRFHNGGHYANGVPMEKLSMTNEVFTVNTMSILSKFQTRLISEFSAVIQPMLYETWCQYGDISKIQSEMSKAACDKLTDKSVAFFLITEKNEPVACLGVCWHTGNERFDLKVEDIVKIKSWIEEIKPLLDISR